MCGISCWTEHNGDTPKGKIHLRVPSKTTSSQTGKTDRYVKRPFKLGELLSLMGFQLCLVILQGGPVWSEYSIHLTFSHSPSHSRNIGRTSKTKHINTRNQRLSNAIKSNCWFSTWRKSTLTDNSKAFPAKPFLLFFRSYDFEQIISQSR